MSGALLACGGVLAVVSSDGCRGVASRGLALRVLLDGSSCRVSSSFNGRRGQRRASV